MNRIGLVLALLALPIVLATYFGGKPLYHAWKQERMLKVAEGCAARGDDAGAIRSFKIALAADSGNPEAWRRLGEYLDSRQPGAALNVWERLAALDPDQTKFRYRAVRDALINRDGAQARSNLNLVPAGGRGSAEYRVLDARTLIAENHLEQGTQALAQIVKAEGTMGEAGFELDRIQIFSGDPATRQEAEGRMRERIRREDSQATAALRAIVMSEAARGDYALADVDAEKLIRRSDANGEDYLRFLDLEFQTNSFVLPASMEKVLSRGLEHPDEIGPILEIFGKWRKSDFAMRWLESQPPEKLEAEPIRRVRIWLAFAGHDVDRAFTLLGTGPNALPTARIADLRRMREEYSSGNPDALKDWKAMLDAGSQDPEWLSIMGNLAAAWGWSAALESTYWTLAEVAPRNPQMWRGLLSIVSKRNDTAAMLKAATGLAKAEPSLVEARTLSLNLNFLLGYGDKADLLRTAEADAALSPGIDTQLVYAMFLTSAGRNWEAIDVADKVVRSPGAELTIRQRIYLGYIYAAAGSPEKARAWFVSPDAARGRVLPEELVVAIKARQLAEESSRREELLRSRPAIPKPVDRKAAGSGSVIGLRDGDGTQPVGGKGLSPGGSNNTDGLFLPIVGGTPTGNEKVW